MDDERMDDCTHIQTRLGNSCALTLKMPLLFNAGFPQWACSVS